MSAPSEREQGAMQGLLAFANGDWRAIAHARGVEDTPEAEIEWLLAQVEQLKEEVDGMARAPYGEFQKMRERAEKAEAQVEQGAREAERLRGISVVPTEEGRQVEVHRWGWDVEIELPDEGTLVVISTERVSRLAKKNDGQTKEEA